MLKSSFSSLEYGFFEVFSLLISLLFIAAALFVFFNRQAIIDEWNILTFQPSNEVSQLMTDDTLAGRGKDLYLASRPEVDDEPAFNQACGTGSEKSIILGCYTMQRIYIYRVTDPRLSGIEEVTAAHEMLHGAYERLSDSERQSVNAMLDTELSKLSGDKHLSDLIKLYNQSEPGQLLNEMHSIIGTEYGNLSPDLETYYKQYFSDRSKVVAYAQAYESVFTSSQARIDAMDSQLAALKKQIDSNNTEIYNEQTELQSELNQLNTLKSEGDLADYNQQVPAYNSKVQSYNTLVDQTRTLVNNYNALIESRNKEVAAQNNLYQSINSHY